MHTTYRTETQKRQVGKVTFTISNMTPVYREEEKAAVKKEIEARLYEIFSKYSSVRS